MKYLIFVTLVFIFGCSVSKSNVEKKDFEVKAKSDVVIYKVDSISSGSKEDTKSIVIDNSVTEVVEVKVDSLNGVTTTTKITKKNDIITGNSSKIEDFSKEVKVEKKDSTTSLNVTDIGKIKSSVERSSYGVYGIGIVLVILAFLVIKYYKKVISLFL